MSGNCIIFKFEDEELENLIFNIEDINGHMEIGIRHKYGEPESHMYIAEDKDSDVLLQFWNTYKIILYNPISKIYIYKDSELIKILTDVRGPRFIQKIFPAMDSQFINELIFFYNSEEEV